MKEIKFKIGMTVEQAVETLLRHKAAGEEVYGMFNGVRLDSNTVTMDDAHIAIVRMTKAKFDAYREELMDKWRS